jgi:predicted permease
MAGPAATLLDDMRFAVRHVSRRPLFAATVVGTLALAMAAATTTFGLATAVLTRPLPFAAAGNLVFVWEAGDRGGEPQPSRVTASRFFEWRDSTAFASMALFGAAGFTLDQPTGAMAIRGVRASANYFQTLGIQPLLGRAFSGDDETPGRERVVVLSHAFWREHFGARADAVGGTLRLSGEPYTVIGVMPPVVFPGWAVNPASVTLDPESRQFWVPIARTPQLVQSSGAHVFGVVARLARSVTAAQAGEALTRATVPDAPDAHRALAAPFRDQFVRDARTPLLTLAFAALAVLLIACANLAALYVSAFEARRGELALRAAIGAGPGRLVRQLTAEALVVSLLGGVTGTLIARAALATLPSLLPPTIPFLTTPALDPPVVAFAVALSVIATVVLTAWPIARLILTAPAPRGVAVAPRGWVYRGLVVSQIAITVALAVAAALLAQSLQTVRGRDAGFALDRVFVANVGMPTTRPPSARQVAAAEQQVLEAIALVPGVRAVATAYDHPLEANWSQSFTVVGDVTGPEQGRAAELRIVSPGYVDALEVDVLDGRAFTERDDLAAPGVMMVNEAFARELGGRVVGRQIQSGTSRFLYGDGVPDTFAIVGVVRNERSRGLEQVAGPAVYMSTRQFPQDAFSVLARTAGDPMTVAAGVRQALRALNPAITLSQATSLDALLSEQLVARRVTTQVTSGFALAGLALAALGMYGVLSIMVAARVRDIGVRLALGASPALVARAMVVESLRTATIGLAAGIVLALAAGRLVAGLLVGVAGHDPVTLVVVAVSLLALAAMAAAAPARRAARVDPVVALRAE